MLLELVYPFHLGYSTYTPGFQYSIRPSSLMKMFCIQSWLFDSIPLAQPFVNDLQLFIFQCTVFLVGGTALRALFIFMTLGASASLGPSRDVSLLYTSRGD